IILLFTKRKNVVRDLSIYLNILCLEVSICRKRAQIESLRKLFRNQNAFDQSAFVYFYGCCRNTSVEVVARLITLQLSGFFIDQVIRIEPLGGRNAKAVFLFGIGKSGDRKIHIDDLCQHYEADPVDRRKLKSALHACLRVNAVEYLTQ